MRGLTDVSFFNLCELLLFNIMMVVILILSANLNILATKQIGIISIFTFAETDASNSKINHEVVFYVRN